MSRELFQASNHDTPRAGQFLTLGAASRLLGLSQEATRRHADKGTLPATRTSAGMRLFRRVDVERVAAERAAERAAK